MNYLPNNVRTAIMAVLTFSFSVTHAQPRLNDSVTEMSSVMKLDTILYLDNHFFENVKYSLCIGSNAREMLVFNYFPISQIDTFDLIFINKENFSIQNQKIPIPSNEYHYLRKYNPCSSLTFDDSTVILCFYNKFIILKREETGAIYYSHSFGHTFGYFNELHFSQDTLLAAKCTYSSSSKSTLLCSFVASEGVLTDAGSWQHPYIEFALFDMNKKWMHFSNKRLFVSNAFDDSVHIISNNHEVAKFSLNLDFNNPDYALDSLRSVIAENEPRKWIDALSEAYYFKSSLVNFIELIDSHYLLIRYIRPGQSYDNRTYYACAKLKPDFTGIEEYVFKEVPEFRVPKNVNQFISKENFDFFPASALLDIHDRDCVLVKAEGKTQKYNDTRANLFLLNQSYLKKYDPLICLYFYHFVYY